MNAAYSHSLCAPAPLRAPLALALAAALGVAILPGLALAATYTVTSDGDAGNGTCAVASCTLRDAIAAATSGTDTVTFASTLSGDTITLDIAGKGNIEITDDLTIQGPGANLLTVSGGNVASGGNGGIFDVTGNPSLTVAISGITLAGGNATGTGGALSFLSSEALTLSNVAIQNSHAQTFGGGFYKNGGSVTVTHSTISGNTAQDFGGGFSSNYTTVVLVDSTISGNYASGGGGGFYLRGGLTVNNSTITGNTAGSFGGGFLLEKFDGALTNSIVANNAAGDSGTEFYAAPLGQGSSITVTANYSLIEGSYHVNGTFSGSNNIFGQDPLLGPLANNGGPTQTLALLPGSPAIGAGDNATCETTDQRGVTRPGGGDHSPTATCDMGAFEDDTIFANGFD